MLTTAVVVAVLVGALAQSVSGIGFSLVCGPLLVAALGPPDGVRLGVLLSLCLNVVLVVRYRAEVPEIDAFGSAIMGAMAEHFGNALPDIVVEPGRFIAGDAAVVSAEVALIISVPANPGAVFMTRPRKLPMGMMTVSSWSPPKGASPFSSSTPTTR